MNATEMLVHSHLMIIQALDALPEEQWDVPNVCGDWSTKEVIAHLASHEQVLLDVLNTFQGHEPTPSMRELLQNGAEFNAKEEERRSYDTAQQVLDEYNDTQVQTESLLAQIPVAQILQAGSIPWYSRARSLNDLITTMYKHSSDHAAQVKAFRAKRHE